MDLFKCKPAHLIQTRPLIFYSIQQQYKDFVKKIEDKTEKSRKKRVKLIIFLYLFIYFLFILLLRDLKMQN